MASSSGVSSGSSLLRKSSCSEDQNQIMDQRKRKRMLSNRESARRSRMRKQKHHDDLTAQVSQLTKENNEIMSNVNVTSQLFLSVEAENSVLRAQLAELGHRLDSLNEIISYVKQSSTGVYGADDDQISDAFDCFMNPWRSFNLSNQPIIDMLMY